MSSFFVESAIVHQDHNIGMPLMRI